MLSSPFTWPFTFWTFVRKHTNIIWFSIISRHLQLGQPLICWLHAKEMTQCHQYVKPNNSCCSDKVSCYCKPTLDKGPLSFLSGRLTEMGTDESVIKTSNSWWNTVLTEACDCVLIARCVSWTLSPFTVQERRLVAYVWRPEQNGRQFADDILKTHLRHWKCLHFDSNFTEFCF